MKNNFLKLTQKEKKVWQTPKPKTFNKVWGNAARLEHVNVRGKNGRKYGGSEK
jgi:hypothetical protein